jgi:molybdate/tungstate transport system substrate-binding protein
LNLPAGEADKILGITKSSPYGSSSQMFSEDSLPTDESTGSVDAGSAYLSQAVQYHLKYIALPANLNFSDPADKSLYETVQINVAGTPFQGKLIALNTTLVEPATGTTMSSSDAKAADAFVAYLMTPAGRDLLAHAGYTLEPPTILLAPGVSSPSAALPGTVLTAFNSLHGKVVT